MNKPADVFDRTHEWADLTGFLSTPGAGLRIGIVRGRRRQGKSFLLEHLCQTTQGLYTLALRQSRVMALARFAESLEAAAGHRLGQFSDWPSALDTAVDLLIRKAGDTPPLLVLDEFPYLAAHSPELPSAIQALYDQRGPATGHPPFRLILCGSSISVMSTLLAGDQALRGRAMLDLKIGPFRYRDAALFWNVGPGQAVTIDAILGGGPGYRDIAAEVAESTPEGLADWLSHTVLNPSHALFTEPDYLLAEDPRIGDRTIYHSIWEAVARGAATPTQIGGLVGMDANALAYHLGVMRDGGFIHYGQDLLWQRKPIITVADPIVRFHQLIVRPNLIDLERREPLRVWQRAQTTFAAKILGPHFEHLAREWTTWHAEEAGLDDIGHVGQTDVPCREHRGHEVDVIALNRESMPRNRGTSIALLGEAKSGTEVKATAQLERLNHIRDLLAALGWDTSTTQFAIFSRDKLPKPPDTDVHHIDLESLYLGP